MNTTSIVTFLAVLLALGAVASPATAETTGAPVEQPEVSPSSPGQAEPEVSSSDPSVEDHIAALNSLDMPARIAAIRALGQLRDARAVSPLARALRADPNPEVRGWIIRSLDQIGTEEARGAIVLAARDDADERVRALALHIAPEAAPPTAPQTYDARETMAMEHYRPYPQQRRRRDPARSFRLAGWLTFGISYASCMIIGGVFLGWEQWAWPLFLPVIGPVVSAGMALDDDAFGDEIIVAAMNLLWFTFQTTGLTLAILGHVRGRRERRERTSSRFNLSIVPSGPGGPGLTVGGQF